MKVLAFRSKYSVFKLIYRENQQPMRGLHDLERKDACNLSKPFCFSADHPLSFGESDSSSQKEVKVNESVGSNTEQSGKQW